MGPLLLSVLHRKLYPGPPFTSFTSPKMNEGPHFPLIYTAKRREESPFPLLRATNTNRRPIFPHFYPKTERGLHFPSAPTKWRRPQNGADTAHKMAPPLPPRPLPVSAHARCAALHPLLLRNGSPRACALRAFTRPGRTIVRGRGGGRGAGGGVRCLVSGGGGGRARILR